MCNGPREDVDILGRMLSYVKKYGFYNILRSIFLMVLLSISIRFCINPDFIFEAWMKFQQKYHAIELEARTELDELVKVKLPNMMYKYHADRAFIIQYHNGTMDWEHGTMRFEVSHNDLYMKKLYEDFNLTWLDMPYYLRDNEVFIGDIYALKKLDKVLYDQLLQFGVEYLACVLVRDDNGKPIAILGFTWDKHIDNFDVLYKEKIENYLYKDSGELMPLIVRNPM